MIGTAEKRIAKSKRARVCEALLLVLVLEPGCVASYPVEGKAGGDSKSVEQLENSNASGKPSQSLGTDNRKLPDDDLSGFVVWGESLGRRDANEEFGCGPADQKVPNIAVNDISLLKEGNPGCQVLFTKPD